MEMTDKIQNKMDEMFDCWREAGADEEVIKTYKKTVIQGLSTTDRNEDSFIETLEGCKDFMGWGTGFDFHTWVNSEPTIADAITKEEYDEYLKSWKQRTIESNEKTIAEGIMTMDEVDKLIAEFNKIQVELTNYRNIARIEMGNEIMPLQTLDKEDMSTRFIRLDHTVKEAEKQLNVYIEQYGVRQWD